ncbi:flagellin [Cellulomonas chitinilytica]|uniref:Flagellin n=1 Tax=Cellulomonas chitinilytica TaxID=398759 RepID=A0A919U0A2_9CELL|nr:flagellin [Cellulomonas chitinilytica]GIG22610.1 flagellin [Cellulomonas chitinilytica]
MGLSINQNIAATNAYRNLSNTQNDLSKSLEKLSSGFRINRAADDAAGLAISEGLRSQVGGLKVAVRNAQDGISVVQTAEGALTETHSILQRMRDLTVQASNEGGLSSDAKGNIQSEISQLKDELTRIADTTQFNGTKLLDGTYSAGKFQVGANAGETITVSVGTSMSAKGLGVDVVDVTAATAGTTATVTAATGGATPAAGTIAVAGDFTLSEKFDGLSGTVSYGGKSIDLSTVKFADGSSAAQRLTALNKAVQDKLGTGITATASATNLTFTGTAATPANPTAAQLASVQVGFAQASGASAAIDKIDTAIKTVSTVRSDLGAVQNRFDHTIKNLNVAVENLSASESRIRDTDMASEMVSFTRAQILSQAGTAMLAQANQIPQGVLSLLR